MRKFLIYFVLVFLLASCGSSTEERRRLSRQEAARVKRADSLALKVAVLPTLDCVPLFVAQETNLFDTLGVNVRLKRFNAQMDCDTALVGGSVEGSVSDLFRTERLRRKGIRLDYLTSTNAYWLLVTNKKARLKRVSQLGDKMIAMTRYSVTDYLSDVALKGVKTTANVYRVQINDVRVRLRMLLNNEMDALWLTEPQATVALAYGNHVIADSRKIGVHAGVIAFRSDLTADAYRRRQLALFTKAYNQACDSLNERGLAHYRRILENYCYLDKSMAARLPKLHYNHVAQPGVSDVGMGRGQY